MRSLATAPAAATLLVGCFDLKAPTEANFRRALQPVAADRFCRELTVVRMAATAAGEPVAPLPILVPSAPIENGPSGDIAQRAVLEQAARDGYLMRSMVTRPARYTHQSLALRPVAMISYEPTDSGKAYFRPVGHGTGGKEVPALCYAKGRVDAVVRWTEPADMLGRTVTEVTYTYDAVDPLPSAPPDVRSRSAQPQEGTATLVKASDGWQAM